MILKAYQSYNSTSLNDAKKKNCPCKECAQMFIGPICVTVQIWKTAQHPMSGEKINDCIYLVKGVLIWNQNEWSIDTHNTMMNPISVILSLKNEIKVHSVTQLILMNKKYKNWENFSMAIGTQKMLPSGVEFTDGNGFLVEGGVV